MILHRMVFCNPEAVPTKAANYPNPIPGMTVWWFGPAGSGIQCPGCMIQTVFSRYFPVDTEILVDWSRPPEASCCCSPMVQTETEDVLHLRFNK